MKLFSFLKSAVLISSLSLIWGCQKEKGSIITTEKQGISAKSAENLVQKSVKRAYRDSFDVELGFFPDLAGGWTMADPDAPAWYPGTGKGNATHMGMANTHFNAHTLRVGGIVTVFHAPFNQYFEGLFTFDVPETVSMVVDDHKGNTVWFQIPEGMPSTHLSPTRIAMEGTVLIVGGTGKFEGATGETTFHAQFDQASYNSGIFEDASVWQNGWIQY